MNVGKICKRDVVTVRESDDLCRAAELMREHHIGYLVAVEPGAGGTGWTPIGVITDRDIVVTVVARQTDPGSLTVGDVMNRQPVLAAEQDSVATALWDMRRIGVRRLPVIGRAGHLIGVLSLDDVLDALASELLDVAGAIRNEQRVEIGLRP